MLPQGQFLVTGGTGFIGRRVVARLLNRGAQVRVLSRSADKASALFGDCVGIAVGDLRDAASLREACRGIHTVIHAGAVYRFGHDCRQLLVPTNVHGTRNLLEAAASARVERFVHVSSAGILDNRRAPVTERDFPGVVSAREAYRHSKWLAELAALEAAQRGLPVVIGCPTSTLGPDDTAPTPTGGIVRDFLDGKFPFASRTALNFIHVDDLADGLLALAGRGRVGERYLLGHHNLWLADFLGLLARASGTRAPRRLLPWPLIGCAGALGEWAGSARICWETAAYARRRQFFDLSKAMGELGWRAQTPIETTVQDSVRWFQRHEQSQAAPSARVFADTNAATN